MRRLAVCALGALAAVAAVAEGEGWTNIEPSRRFPAPVKPLVTVPLDRGLDAFVVDWRDGATGSVRIVSSAAGPQLEIAKRNDRGYVLVRTREPFAFPVGTKLRAYAACEADDADGEYSYGYLQLYADREDLTYFSKLDTQGRGGPKMTHIANTPPGMPDRKLASFVADAKVGTNVTAAIVVAGRASTSRWSRWGIEDHAAASAAWREKVRNRRAPVTAIPPNDLPDDRFDALIASGVDHTAAVRREGGVAALFIDGARVLPVCFKGAVSKDLNGFYGGAKMAAMGMDFQSTHIRLGVTKGQAEGYWSKDGFDVKGAVAAIRRAMRRAPQAKYLLSVTLDAYPEFAEEHPDEVWVNDQGRKVFGHNVHSAFSLPKTMDPKRHWFWMSNHSLVWRDAVKARLGELIAELKRTGLSRAIVGVHLGGYHDGQFATVHPDYSKPAVAGFRRWLRAKYASEDALRAAWRDAAVTFDAATPPVRHDNYGRHDYYVPGEDQAMIDYAYYLKQGPFFVQEDIARHVKRCFGKEIVAVRYCMSAFGGSYNAAYDITAFANSDAIDILCAQPGYGERLPALACGGRLPFASFHRHGKLYLNEFDLRTYGAMTFWEGELAAIQFGLAEDDAAWRTINRKLAGQMFAARMGWWYLDMAGGWFEPDAIAADIREVLSVGRALQGAPCDDWRPDVAFVTDEEGALLRNMMCHYYNPDEQTLMGMTYASSGVPFDSWLMDDWLKDPSLADRYRLVVFRGMYDFDARREEIVRRLERRGATVVLTAGTGLGRGAERTGFSFGVKPFPAQHETSAVAGVDWNMNSALDEGRLTRTLGVRSGWPWQLASPMRTFIREDPDVTVVSRFTEDGTAAAAERRMDAGKRVMITEAGGLSPAYLHRLAVEAGAYVPSARLGLQVDMNGGFASIHCLRAGDYLFRLPRGKAAVNLKTGEAAPVRDGAVPMTLTAGETRWYAFPLHHRSFF